MPTPGVRGLPGRLPPHNDHLRPITVPHHVLVTSPARSHANHSQGKELPLHLIHLILSHLEDVGDLARLTRTSRLFHYMTLPRLYENVTLRSYSEMRYVDGRPEGYGGGSPFAFALNTLVTRNVTDYIQSFRVIGEWKEHDLDDYSKGRVPDNSMMLQVAMRACLDRMKHLTSFAWELNIKPLQTVYQSLMAKPNLTSLTLRFQSKRIPGPATTIGPLPNLITLVVYDIDPLCNPDDISGILLTSTKLENLKMHFNPRMRDTGEESINLMTFFGRCVAAQRLIAFKRMALYNMYARNPGHEFQALSDASKMEEVTSINSMGSSNPMTVFLDDTWRINSKQPIPYNLKMIRSDLADREHAAMLRQFRGLDRMYLISNPRSKGSKSCSTVATPSTPTSNTPTLSNGTSASTNGTPVTEQQCRGLASEYIAVIQANHGGIRHLLLPENWQLSDNALLKLVQSLPELEQLGFSCTVPPLESLRRIVSTVPKLFALRILIHPDSELATKFVDNQDIDMHIFAMSTEFWRPEYNNIKYIGMGDKLVFKLGGVVYPKQTKPIPEGQENSLNAKMQGPRRVIESISREEANKIEIWGMDTTEFDPKFP